MSEDKEPIAWVYRGDGEHIYGVPDRSLTQLEFDELSPQLQREVRAGRLYYEYVKPAPPKDEPKQRNKATDTDAGEDD